MISEVDAMLQSSKSVLESVDRHKKMIESCENILKELNPIYAKEQERDTAIEDLTAQMNKMQTVLNKLETFLNKKESHEND
jgi:ABC-type enterochelin transport system substrate-binding protein